MNLLDLTSQQLKRAAAIKDQIAALNQELSKIFGIAADGANNHRAMSVAAKRKIATAQKARWAKLRGAKPAALPVKAATKTKTMSPASRRKLSAKLKAFWKAKKAGKK
ncbi:MAG: hypothetical protein ACREP3_16020 [Candidatus Binatia bacterium]